MLLHILCIHGIPYRYSWSWLWVPLVGGRLPTRLLDPRLLLLDLSLLLLLETSSLNLGRFGAGKDIVDQAVVNRLGQLDQDVGEPLAKGDPLVDPRWPQGPHDLVGLLEEIGGPDRLVVDLQEQIILSGSSNGRSLPPRRSGCRLGRMSWRTDWSSRL